VVRYHKYNNKEFNVIKYLDQVTKEGSVHHLISLAAQKIRATKLNKRV